jgi:hypothetical protein
VPPWRPAPRYSNSSLRLFCSENVLSYGTPSFKEPSDFTKDLNFLKISVFWFVAPCSLVEVYQRFRGPCCLHHQGDSTSETLVNFYQTTRCYNPEDSNLHTHRRENLKSYLNFLTSFSRRTLLYGVRQGYVSISSSILLKRTHR